jgi:hypothetical protein
VAISNVTGYRKGRTAEMERGVRCPAPVVVRSICIDEMA